MAYTPPIKLEIDPTKPMLRVLSGGLKLTEADKARMGTLLLQQVTDRFMTSGRSGGVTWKPTRSGRAPLRGNSGLLNSFVIRIHRDGVGVYSTAKFARVHQLGTVGAGGVLPTIRPKKAKALFIPLTERASSSQRVSGKEALHISKALGSSAKKVLRVATSGSYVKSKIPGDRTLNFSGLREGRVKNGLLEVKGSDGQWRVGQPDFIFSKKSDIPPRPMLPVSDSEKSVQTEMLVRSLNKTLSK